MTTVESRWLLVPATTDSDGGDVVKYVWDSTLFNYAAIRLSNGKYLVRAVASKTALDNVEAKDGVTSLPDFSAEQVANNATGHSRSKSEWENHLTATPPE